jgi:hypothetical protein
MHKVEFGDFQTPDSLARGLCEYLVGIGVRPSTVVEPTCGVGAFVMAAIDAFPEACTVLGVEINQSYLSTLSDRLEHHHGKHRVTLREADFFRENWRSIVERASGRVLVLGNLPWVTNATLGALGSNNLPQKSNFLGHSGFDAISGKANFDISESMLLTILDWFRTRPADIAMLVKTSVARKVLAHAERRKDAISEARMVRIDAKAAFAASVDACLLVIRLTERLEQACYDYTVLSGLGDSSGVRVGHRRGLTVSDIGAFEGSQHLLGASPEKWRSGVKHDASAVMELSESGSGLVNGLGEAVAIEPTFLYPLMKGSDIGGGKPWRRKWVLVTQRAVGEPTDSIRTGAPKTWAYLESHAAQLDKRTSTIYEKNPRFSVFGIGPYAFRPWRVAICGLYKSLSFRLVGPIEGKPVMFDDTVYYLSFDGEEDARAVLSEIDSEAARTFLSSLIFWDEKRPIKASILNLLDWTKLTDAREPQLSLL